MKNSKLYLFVCIAWPLMTFGCGTESADQDLTDMITQAVQGQLEINLSKADEGHRIKLKDGKILVINLESNPATGYSWEVGGLDKKILRQLDSKWKSNTPQLLGASGIQEIRFAGVSKGNAKIDFAYRKLWENNLPPANTLSVFVEVVNKSSTANSPEPPTIDVEPNNSVAEGNLYDWCTDGYCSEVKDQGNCGSCWAFGTVGPLEVAIEINDGLEKDLSEQYLVSCNTDGWGCNGGWWAHDYHKDKIPPGEPDAGAVYETDFSYTADDAPCNGPHAHNEKIANWFYVGTSSSVPSTEAIKQAITDYGPVSAAVCVDNAFQSYTGGVFNPRKDRCTSVNHGVVLVGWDDTDEAWILRNSWGTGWGESGYMRIAYGKSKVGYSANYVVYGEAPPPPPPPDGATHVSAIDMWYTQRGPFYSIYTKVAIVDENNNPVPNATADLQMTLPDGSLATGSGPTEGDGTVTFKLDKTRSNGEYTSEVTNVTHSSFTYDSSANVETSESLSVP